MNTAPMEDPFANKHVHIVNQAGGGDSVNTTIYITNEIAEPSEYTEMLATLAAAQENDTIELIINSPGGRVDTAVMILNALSQTNAFTKAKVVGEAASAASMIMLAADELEVAPFAFAMIHNYSTGMYGKGHELKTQSDFIHSAYGELFHGVYKGFLSKKERKQVIEGKDMYLSADDIEARWGKVQEARQKYMAKIVADQEVAFNDDMIRVLESRGYHVTKDKKKD